MKLLRTITALVSLAVLMTGVLSASALLASASPRTAQATPSAMRLAKEERVAADAERAKTVLAQLADKYEHLDGTTVIVGKAPDGREAVAYYTKNQIVIDADHAVGLETILAHEVWHIIDWRDNGRLDWGEQVPPVNASAFLR